MNHESLLETLKSPGVLLLCTDNAPLILSFLYQEFKAEQRPVRLLDTLIENLSRTLERLNQFYGDRYRDTAKNYIADWSEKRGWLRIYRQGASPDYLVELTTGAQQALAWASELQPREFLGTETRFEQILVLLNDIVQRGTTDPQTRIHQLEAEKARIEGEIQRITMTAQVEGLSGGQIRERFQLATEQADMLLRDFTTVQERFRAIARLVQTEQNQPDARKGTVVGKMLDADDRLRQSEVGRSFYAFWDYLQHPERRDALYLLLDQAVHTDPIDISTPQAALLRQMPRYLIDAGLKVDQTNHRLAEQLRRLLDEGHAAESRRIRALIAEVKVLYSAHREALDGARNAFSAIESLPETEVVMARGLWSAKEEVSFMLEFAVTMDDVDEALPVDLIDPFWVDEGRILERIERALVAQREVRLTDLLAEYPVEKGLNEVVAYLQVAEKRPDVHIINDEPADHVRVRPASAREIDWLLLRLPYIVFRRADHAGQHEN